MTRRHRLFRTVAILASAVVLAGPAPAFAAGRAASTRAAADPVIRVATTGHDTAGCGSSASPCLTIPFAYGEAAAGDTIDVAAGRYVMTGPFVIRKARLRFTGARAGVDARTRTPGGSGETVITMNLGTAGAADMWTADADSIVIDGFTFADNANGSGVTTSEQHSGYEVIDDIFTDNLLGLRPSSDGVLRSVFDRNVYADNNNVRVTANQHGNGVFTFRPLANARFTDSTFADNQNSPINIAGGEVPGGSKDIIIADNDMDGEFGITLVAVSDVLITRNQMIGGWNAVQVSGACHDITVTRNTIADKTRGGILLFTGFAAVTNTGITIASNIITRTATVPGRYGIEISRTRDVSIRHNLITESGEGGIGFTTRGQDVPSEGVTITQNTITGSGGPGISVSEGGYTGPMTVRLNRIVNNDPHRGILDGDHAAAIDARENWWGCNEMPAGAGCDRLAGTAAGTVEFGPWLVLRIDSTPADILAGQEAKVVANLRHDSAGALAAGPFFAPVIVHFTTKPGHLVPVAVGTTADLFADTRWPAGQPRPGRFCARTDHQTVCLHFGPHPEVSLRVTATAFPDSGVAGQPITYTITVVNEGPADAFGVTVVDDLTRPLDGFTWTCTASAPPVPVRPGLRYRLDQHHGRGHRGGRHRHLPGDRRASRGQHRRGERHGPRRASGGHRRLRLHACLLRHRHRLLRTRTAGHRPGRDDAGRDGSGARRRGRAHPAGHPAQEARCAAGLGCSRSPASPSASACLATSPTRSGIPARPGCSAAWPASCSGSGSSRGRPPPRPARSGSSPVPRSRSSRYRRSARTGDSLSSREPRCPSSPRGQAMSPARSFPASSAISPSPRTTSPRATRSCTWPACAPGMPSSSRPSTAPTGTGWRPSPSSATPISRCSTRCPAIRGSTREPGSSP